MDERTQSPESDSSLLSCITVQTNLKSDGARSSLSASPPTSTPPTSHGDEASIASDAMKTEITETHEMAAIAEGSADVPSGAGSAPGTPQSETRRPARASRAKVSTYNVQMLAGTAIHTPTKYLEKHHKNVLHGDIPTASAARPNTAPAHSEASRRPGAMASDDPVESQLAQEAAQAAQRRKSSRVIDLRREALHNNQKSAADSVLQRGEAVLSSVKVKVQEKAQSLRSTFGGSSRGSLKPAKPSLKRARSTTDLADKDTEEDLDRDFVKPKTKKWESHGLFVGQHRNDAARLKESANKQRRKSAHVKESKILPLPMFGCERMLNTDPKKEWRDFKLPFDVYSPLPRKVKVEGWTQLRKNRFIGDASSLWKHDKQDASQCYCLPDDGCGEDCHNRIMSYECDATNCRLTPAQCSNRPFAELKKRSKGNLYDYGVQVMETGDRGYGVRAMRTFRPHQIIVEYAGEIITQQECERRMKKEYKNNKCYYLMSFDNKMIIDATKGTIARFVNHSCEPNCEMIKWTVGGEPRMALFAGSRGIMTGDELTYDYNFDPFSSKNIQECRCGTRSCRGVLGPKPKDQNREKKLTGVGAFIAGAKRKAQELLGMDDFGSPQNSPKKRKLMGNSALTKHQNAVAAAAAKQQLAEKLAAEHATQKASREDRALRRTESEGNLKKSSRRVQRKSRASLPATKVTKTITRNYKIATPKSAPSRPGALKPITKSPRLSNSRVAKRNNQAISNKKSRLPQVTKKTPKTPAIVSNEPDPESESERSSDEESPNITPASLRSANKSNVAAKRSFKQTKLNFAPVNPRAKSLSPSPTPSSDEMEVDSDDEYVATAHIKKVVAAKLGGRRKSAKF